jgi:protein required for attachment to host cells
MARARTWALVTNGVHARILRGLEDSASKAPDEKISKARSRHLLEILSDKSGRSFVSVGVGRRSAMEPRSDPIWLDMQDFARETLEVLEKSHRSGQFDRLAIFAAPKMLGILRQEMPAALRQAVFLERPNNLVHLGEAELRSEVMSLLKT